MSSIEDKANVLCLLKLILMHAIKIDINYPINTTLLQKDVNTMHLISMYGIVSAKRDLTHVLFCFFFQNVDTREVSEMSSTITSYALRIRISVSWSCKELHL